MIGVAGAIAIIGAAAIAGGAMAYAANASADAQKAVAATNAKATVDAAKVTADKAAEGQIEAAKQDAMARMHESDVAYQQDQQYLQFEKWSTEHEDSLDKYSKQAFAEIDAIDISQPNTMDMYYANEGGWGSTPEAPYDYGDGGMSFS